MRPAVGRMACSEHRPGSPLSPAEILAWAAFRAHHPALFQSLRDGGIAPNLDRAGSAFLLGRFRAGRKLSN